MRLEVPRSAKLWLGFAVVWIASSIDLVPEFILIAGPLDDAIVAALALRHLLRRTDRSVVFEHWRGDPATLDVIVRGPACSFIGLTGPCGGRRVVLAGG
ncbi:MAG TPA: DUF1232 domain-containing protein, partial [Actinomycetota bacterium]|nr:DUF1232 domain-containing protein [Actinomycetota bacterium]